MQLFSVSNVPEDQMKNIINAFPLHDEGAERLIGFVFDPIKVQIQGEFKFGSAVIIHYLPMKKKDNITLTR